MVNRQELENLDFMLQNGMIDEKTYQCHRKALNNQHKKLHQTNLSLIDLEKFSIFKAFKFSFSPVSFMATFVFLLVASIILVGLFRIIWGRPECLIQLINFVEHKKVESDLSFYLITTFLYAFWQALWFSFFSYFSFTFVKQIYGPFSFKRYIIKSFLLLMTTYLWLSCIVFLWSSFVIHILKQQPGISNIMLMEAKQIPFAILYLLIICAISYFFTISTMTLTGPLKTRLVLKAFWKGLHSPIYVLKFWIGVILNVFLVGFLFYFTKTAFLPLLKIGYNAILDVKSLSSLSSMLEILVVYAFAYIIMPKKYTLWLKLSALFIIPSAIVYSMFSHQLSIQATIIFFLFMHLIWAYFYIAFFFTIQSLSFWNNLLTQMWCCTMNGEYVTLIEKKEKKSN